MLDVALALGAFAGWVALLAARGDSGADTRELDVLGVLLAGLGSLPLVAWRRAPLAVFVVTAASSAVLNGLSYPAGPPVGPTIALFLLALNSARVRAPKWATGVVVFGLFVIHVSATAIAEDKFPTVALLFGALVWGGAWVIGEVDQCQECGWSYGWPFDFVDCTANPTHPTCPRPGGPSPTPPQPPP